MRVLDGEQVLMRIFIGESDVWHGQPLYTAIIHLCQEQGIAGKEPETPMAELGWKSVGVLELTALPSVARPSGCPKSKRPMCCS